MSARALSATSSLVTSLALAWGCVPTVEEDPSLALDGQILALQFQPAEAKPTATSSATALVAHASSKDVSFNLCKARKALSELGPVAPECFDTKGDSIQRLGKGDSVAFTVPKDACRLFGPQRPPAEGGQPPGRPVDPDATGGYYQPIVARLDDAVLGNLRLDCGLPGGSQEQIAEYNQTHVPNQNPVAESVQVRIDNGKWQPLPDDGRLRVPRNASVTIRSRWSAPERYMLLSSDGELTKPREQYLASFFSSVGGFVEHRASVDKSTVDAEWDAPSESGQVTFWLVVRDGRGGTGWTTFEVSVN